MATESGPPPVPGTNTGVKSLSKELQLLTSEDGPLVRLVEEVRRSNELGVQNAKEVARVNRRMFWTMVGFSFLFLGMVGCAVMLALSVGVLADMQKQLQSAADSSERLIQAAAETDRKLQATKDQLDETPKVVADERGALKLVAPVRRTPDASVVAARPEATSKAKKRRKKRRDAPQPKIQVVEPAPTPSPAPSKASAGAGKPPAPAGSEKSAKAAKEVIEIPLDLGDMELK